MTKRMVSRWSSASGILVAESFFKGFIGQEVGPILPHFCNAWMAKGETPSEKHSIRSSFEIIPTAPRGPKGPGPARDMTFEVLFALIFLFFSKMAKV